MSQLTLNTHPEHSGIDKGVCDNLQKRISQGLGGLTDYCGQSSAAP